MSAIIPASTSVEIECQFPSHSSQRALHKQNALLFSCHRQQPHDEEHREGCQLRSTSERRLDFAPGTKPGGAEQNSAGDHRNSDRAYVELRKQVEVTALAAFSEHSFIDIHNFHVAQSAQCFNSYSIKRVTMKLKEARGGLSCWWGKGTGLPATDS